MKILSAALPQPDSVALHLSIGEHIAPNEMLLIPAGRSETTKGPLVFSERSATSVFERLRALGRENDRLNFDYGHAQLAPLQSYDSSRSAGWYSLAVRDGALWALDIEWTPAAQKALQEQEFRYYSPALTVDADTSEVLSVINVALTNIPAMLGISPIIPGIQAGTGPTDLAFEDFTPDEGTTKEKHWTKKRSSNFSVPSGRLAALRSLPSSTRPSPKSIRSKLSGTNYSAMRKRLASS